VFFSEETTSMKLKLVVVDLELSPRAKRLALRIGIPLLALCGATAAYAAVPVTFTAGTTLHAADLNTNFSALDARISVLEKAPKVPHYAQATVKNDGTIFEQNNNTGNNLVVTRTSTGVYHVTWNGSDYPNGAAPVITPSLNNPEMLQMSALVEVGSGTNTDGIYVVTMTPAGVATDGWFTVLVLGQ
jgi:hypothetical protein